MQQAAQLGQGLANETSEALNSALSRAIGNQYQQVAKSLRLTWRVGRVDKTLEEQLSPDEAEKVAQFVEHLIAERYGLAQPTGGA